MNSMPLYELDVESPVAYIDPDGKLVNSRNELLSADDFPRVLFAAVPTFLHLSNGISLAPLEREHVGKPE